LPVTDFIGRPWLFDFGYRIEVHRTFIKHASRPRHTAAAHILRHGRVISQARTTRACIIELVRRFARLRSARSF
jgi:hypothetical protein